MSIAVYGEDVMDGKSYDRDRIEMSFAQKSDVNFVLLQGTTQLTRGNAA